jgi:2-keto-4-pentenoate hydratase/2-oxohepta-3-ene-1,7-dioic acid hydratase in catechol pathway
MVSMGVGLGPSFGKDWVNSLGPCIVTPDELGDILSKRVIIRVNGEERLNTIINDTISIGGKWYWSFNEMCNFVSHNQKVHYGEVWGSGTIPGGCELERGNMANYLKSGDIVEIQVEGIGTLRNTIA